jgi:Bacterial Ig domain/Fibronectin type III domain
MIVAMADRVFHIFDTGSSFHTSKLIRWILVFAVLVSPVFATSSVNLSWDPNPEPDITGYRLKYGTSSGTYSQSIDVGNVTTAAVPSLTAGQTYYFVVTAFNASAMESQPSNEVTFSVTVTVNQSPLVAITSPDNGSNVVAPATVTISANASDSDGSVNRVEFYSGATKLGESIASPYSHFVNLTEAGTYVFTARAFDNQGASSDSAAVTITVTIPSGPRNSEITTVYYQQTGVQLTVAGTAGLTQSVYVSNDLKTWSLLSNVVNSSGTQVVNDPLAASLNQRFYRVTDATTTTEPVGFTKLRVVGTKGNQTSAHSYLAVNMVNPARYKGLVTTNGPHSIVDNQANWTDGQFNGANGSHYLEIVSGPWAGTTTDIVGTNAAAKTITTDEDLSSVLAGGEQFTIRKHRTIGDVFGRNNEAKLKAGTSVTGSDEVRLFNPVTQTFLSYYFNTTGAGWRSSTNSATDAADTELYVDQGVSVCRRATGDITLVVTGAVKCGQTLVPIGANSNLCANMYPAGTLTLGNCGLYTGNSMTGLAGSSKLNSADEVQIWNGSSFRKYFYKSGGAGGIGWRLSSSTKADASNTQIPVGASIYVIRKNGRPPFNWKVRQPF